MHSGYWVKGCGLHESYKIGEGGEWKTPAETKFHTQNVLEIKERTNWVVLCFPRWLAKGWNGLNFLVFETEADSR